MTESEWLNATDPTPMLEFLRDKGSERKLRLLACACCRHMDRRGNVTGLAVVELAEQVADGLLPLGEAVRREASVRRLFVDTWALAPASFALVRLLARDPQAWRPLPRTALLRCLFGNPFRPVALDPGWLTWHDGAVVKLAQAAYEERELPAGHLDTARLAVLADALEDAGCTDATILDHLRGPGLHVRGCWVVDTLLGKE
jgi:hypothetical protein